MIKLRFAVLIILSVLLVLGILSPWINEEVKGLLILRVLFLLSIIVEALFMSKTPRL